MRDDWRREEGREKEGDVVKGGEGRGGRGQLPVRSEMTFPKTAQSSFDTMRLVNCG